MDRISALIPPIKSENLPPPSSPSESNLTFITNTPTINIPQPPFVNSINELRSFSTALSTFLSRYDELNNHLNFIKLSIDAKLDEHLIDDTVNPNQSPLTCLIESFCDRNVTDCTEAVGSERNPNGTVSDCERSREYVSAHGRCMKEDGEIDGLIMLDEVYVLKDCDEIDVSKKLLETDTDILKDYEGIDVSEKALETDTDVLMDSEGIDVSEELRETDNDGLMDSEAVDVSRRLLETDTLRVDEETDVLKDSNEIDVSEKLLETDMVKVDEETDVSKMNEEVNVSEKDDGIDILMNHEEISKDYEETDILMNQEEIDTSVNREDFETSMNHEEIDILNQLEETDFSMDHEEIDIFKKHEEIDTLKNNEEADLSKKQEIIDILKKHEEIIVSRKPESLNHPKKHEEADIFIKHEEIHISKNPLEIDMEENDESEKHEERNDSKKVEKFDISKKHEEINVSKKQEETDHMKPVEIDVCKKHDETNNLKKNKEFGISKKHGETNVLKKHEEIDPLKKSAVSELEFFCARMGAKGLKKYVATHISDMNKLREELPKALKLAKDPAKLVLDSIGRFFLQTSKSYHNDINHHKQIVSRLASVMILECFVMISSDGIEISKEKETDAAEAAVRWKQRMIREGGVRHMDEADARGLLLLISGFGIRDRDFKIVDIKDLIMASNVKGISTALRRSIILIPKVPEVIDMMVKNNLEIEAADTAYTFRLEDKCHPQIILMRFLHNKIRDIQNGSPFQMLMAMKQQVFDLKSVKQCLESHKVEPSNLLSDFKINERIQHLEKEINNWNLTPKRKSTEPEFLENLKRPCYSHENMPHGPKPVGHYPVNLYNQPSEPRSSCFDFDRGLAGSFGTRVYGGTVAGPIAHTVNVRPYGWHGDPPYIDNCTGQPYSRQSQPYDSQPYGRSSLESFPGFSARRTPASDLYSFADTVVEHELRGSHKAGNGTSRPPFMY